MGNNNLLQPSQPTEVNQTLATRGQNYGKFSGVAEIEQGFKTLLRAAPNWDKLSADKKSALEMIVHKMARVLNGNPEYSDSWHDIAGYAKLIENELTGIGPV